MNENKNKNLKNVQDQIIKTAQHKTDVFCKFNFLLAEALLERGQSTIDNNSNNKSDQTFNVSLQMVGRHFLDQTETFSKFCWREPTESDEQLWV